MSADRSPLLDLAASVADGTDVDWAQAESRAGGDDRRLVRHLRLVSNIAALHRSLPGDDLSARGGEAAHPETTEPAGPRWGHLVLLERIGQGTSAEVHRAWDIELQREVALKLFTGAGGASDATHTRVLEEARRLARVRHPNVAVVYGADRQDERVGFWMELVRGASLEEILERQGPFGVREAALVGIDVCGAVAAVHGAGLLHRDIKAQNVLREDGGRIVLADFGTGEPLADAAARPRMAGTPMYLAPEILSGHHASAQSDLYSLGVLLFHLVTGEFPVAARTLQDLLRAHSAGQRRHLRDLRPDLPAPFVHVVERLLSPNPADRYQSAGALDASLRATLDVGARADDAAPRATSHRPWARLIRNRGVLAAAAILSVAVLALAIWANPAWRSPAATPPQGVQAIAVLPLADLTGGAGPPYLAEALTDQLIATVGQLHGLRVTSRTSVLSFTNRDVPMSEIARRLGVGAILEGTVAMGGRSPGTAGRVRVNARLIMAGTDTQLWSGTFERALGDTLALQADLARAIAREVNVAITPREAAHLDRRQVTSPAAEAAYFEGQYHLIQYGPESASRALVAFERAARLDVNYAPAYVGIAQSHITLGFGGAITQAEARAKALAMATRAMELDDQSPEAHATVADLKFYYDWDWTGAEQAYERALALNPSASRVRLQFARYLAAMGRLDHAAQQGLRAADIDPLSAEAVQLRALMLYYDRDYEGAAAMLQLAQDLDPRSAGTHVILSRVREEQQRVMEALHEANTALAIAEHPGVRAHAARLMALAGDHAGARAALRQIAAGPLRARPGHLAYAHLALGDTDRARALLEQAVAERDPAMLWLAVDPRVDELRSDPRFIALLTRIGLPSSLDQPARRH